MCRVMGWGETCEGIQITHQVQHACFLIYHQMYTIISYLILKKLCVCPTLHIMLQLILNCHYFSQTSSKRHYGWLYIIISLLYDILSNVVSYFILKLFIAC